MLFLGFICDEQYYDELVAYGDFPLWCLTAPPSPLLKRWDYGCWTMYHIAQ